MTATATSRLIPAGDAGSWDAVLTAIPHGIAHTSRFAALMDATAGTSTCLWVTETSSGPVACPLIRRTSGALSDVASPMGFGGFCGPADDPEVVSAWDDYLRDSSHVCAYVAQNPAFGDLTAWPEAMVVRRRSMYLLDIRPEPQELLVEMSSARRRELRAPIADMTIAVDRADVGGFVRAAYGDFARRRGAVDSYLYSEATLSGLTRGPGALVVGAVVAGRVRAAAVFGYTRYSADYLIGMSEQGAERLTARVMWAGILELRSVGVPQLNMGGGIREDDGVAEFKRRFGAKRVLLPQLRQVADPDRYGAACRASGVTPDDAAYFPAYRSGR